MLAFEGFISLKQIYSGGTKIEEQAGRYTHVWGNSIKTKKTKILAQLTGFWNYAQSISNDDDPNLEAPEFKEISKEVVQKIVVQIDDKLSGNEKATTKAKSKLRYIKQNFGKNLQKHEKQETILQSTRGLLCVSDEAKKCAKPSKELKQPKQDTHNIYRITKSKIVEAFRWKVGVLKEKEIEA